MSEEKFTLLVTKRAAEKMKKSLEQSFDLTKFNQAGIRVKVVPGGCSGFQYDILTEEKPNTDDTVIESEGLSLFIDPMSIKFLNGLTVDFSASIINSGFTFENPNATGNCGCGTSFSV